MDWASGLGIVGGSFAVLLALGVPVAFTFLFILLAGSIVLIGDPVGPYQAVQNLFGSIGSFALAPIPLFVMMGEVMLHSGLAANSLDAISKLIGKVPARLSLVAIVAGAIFGMLTGSTMASTAILGTVLIPEMLGKGYDRKMIFGPIIASGSLAMIIPPSSLTIVYGTVAQIPVGPLLIAGLLPGILVAINYSINVMIRVKFNPSLVPAVENVSYSRQEKMKLFFVDLLPLAVIIFLVTGIFVIGVGTPTEAAGLGALGTIVVAAFYKRMSWQIIFKSVRGTVKVTSMTLLIIGGSVIFSSLLSYSGITRAVVEFAVGLNVSKYVLLAIMAFIVLVLGTIMESVPIIMVTVPIFVPIAAKLGFDQIWFGMIMLLCIQIGLATPPFGLLLFVMQGIAPKGTTFKELYMSVLPFLLSDLITIAILILFPIIVTVIPNLVMK
ncbi:MAG: TRAP transporter large permease [Desulfitobacteriaceae bacterium]